MIDSLALAVSVPLLAALLATAWPTRAGELGLLGALGTAAAALWVAWSVWEQGGLRSPIGGWGAPLGIALVADGLSAALLAMTALVALAVSVQAGGYFRAESTRRHFWPLWLLLWTALNGLLLGGDLFNIYVTLELLGLTAVALGALGGQGEAIAASLRYLLVSLVGSMSYLLGVALLYTAHGTLDMALLETALAPGPVAGMALMLMTGGLAMKAALFPLHFWLPPAHANAPTPVSAALSALVVKVAFYLILRLWLGPFASVVTPGAATLMGALGALAVLWGSWRALHAERLKLLAAYSTVAQIGYLFLFLPLMQATPEGAGREDLVAGAVLMALSHSFAKSALFLAAGVVRDSAGHDRIKELGGTAQRLPATTFAIGLAGLALIGLPPSGGFLGKWLLLQGALASGQWWWILLVLVGTLMTAAYVFRVLSRAFNLEPTPQGFISDPRAELPALALAAIAAVALGLGAAPLWPLLSPGGAD